MEVHPVGLLPQQFLEPGDGVALPAPEPVLER
jgi:hypothetical protein